MWAVAAGGAVGWFVVSSAAQLYTNIRGRSLARQRINAELTQAVFDEFQDVDSERFVQYHIWQRPDSDLAAYAIIVVVSEASLYYGAGFFVEITCPSVYPRQPPLLRVGSRSPHSIHPLLWDEGTLREPRRLFPGGRWNSRMAIAQLVHRLGLLLAFPAAVEGTPEVLWNADTRHYFAAYMWRPLAAELARHQLLQLYEVLCSRGVTYARLRDPADDLSDLADDTMDLGFDSSGMPLKLLGVAQLVRSSAALSEGWLPRHHYYWGFHRNRTFCGLMRIVLLCRERYLQPSAASSGKKNSSNRPRPCCLEEWCQLPSWKRGSPGGSPGEALSSSSKTAAEAAAGEESPEDHFSAASTCPLGLLPEELTWVMFQFLAPFPVPIFRSEPPSVL
eukprot:NODE_2052_length_1311_cov_18.669572_g1866_i0.p1 GENE.NODE_2052_length_1311_cov_18.669572_g1866_i0~~NODE_2052_length_1311_cov_18.669572_g1866_i0.p1  ORF type:complete len:390 (+),score=43.48 NODE_2052_length_1311_cov_18.669572_g1866_i0:123-1292(+)